MANIGFRGEPELERDPKSGLLSWIYFERLSDSVII